MAAAPKKEETGFLAPGVVDVSRMVKGSPVAIFVKGLEAYTAAANKNVTIRGSDGSTVEAQFHGAEAGRLFGLAQRFMHQSPVLAGGTHQVMGGNFQDLNFFGSLRDAYGVEGIDPLAPYTVLLVTVPPSN